MYRRQAARLQGSRLYRNFMSERVHSRQNVPLRLFLHNLQGKSLLRVQHLRMRRGCGRFNLLFRINRKIFGLRELRPLSRLLRMRRKLAVLRRKRLFRGQFSLQHLMQLRLLPLFLPFRKRLFFRRRDIQKRLLFEELSERTHKQTSRILVLSAGKLRV